MTTFAEVAEGVRNTMASYTHALDDGRTEDVLATFCSDGSIDMGHLGVHEGTDALRAAYTGWVPRRPQPWAAQRKLWRARMARRCAQVQVRVLRPMSRNSETPWMTKR